MRNLMKTALLMAAITALFGAVGAAIGGAQGMLVALAIGAGLNFFAYWFSDAMVLRMYNARGLPMPRVYLIDEAQPNAFATGRNPEHAAVAATTGLLQLLTARELGGVMAHELAHVKHRDILTSTITASIAGAIGTLANFGMFFGGNDEDNRNPVFALAILIVAPIAAMLIQFAISRSREYDADRGGAAISGDPQALASALAKIDRYARGVPLAPAEANPSTAQMMIVNPLRGGGVARLFSTHPATEERVARLLALA